MRVGGNPLSPLKYYNIVRHQIFFSNKGQFSVSYSPKFHTAQLFKGSFLFIQLHLPYNIADGQHNGKQKHHRAHNVLSCQKQQYHGYDPNEKAGTKHGFF